MSRSRFAAVLATFGLGLAFLPANAVLGAELSVAPASIKASTLHSAKQKAPGAQSLDLQPGIEMPFDWNDDDLAGAPVREPSLPEPERHGLSLSSVSFWPGAKGHDLEFSFLVDAFMQ